MNSDQHEPEREAEQQGETDHQGFLEVKPPVSRVSSGLGRLACSFDPWLRWKDRLYRPGLPPLGHSVLPHKVSGLKLAGSRKLMKLGLGNRAMPLSAFDVVPLRCHRRFPFHTELLHIAQDEPALLPTPPILPPVKIR